MKLPLFLQKKLAQVFKNYKIFTFILVVLLSYSCISNKKTLYLQEKTDLYGPAQKDSILRNYYIKPYEYKLQHEDVLSIQINSLTPSEYDFLSRGLPESRVTATRNSGSLHGYLIDSEGNIEFPVVGKIKLGGKTIYEAEDEIKKIAQEYLEEPVVRVRLLNFRFTVLGEILGDGESISTYDNRVSLLEGIGLAGGLGEFADRENIKIIRQYNDEAKVFYVNLLEEDFVNSPFYYIHPSDIIIIPPLKQKPFKKYFAQNIGLILSSISLVITVMNLISINR